MILFGENIKQSAWHTCCFIPLNFSLPHKNSLKPSLYFLKSYQGARWWLGTYVCAGFPTSLGLPPFKVKLLGCCSMCATVEWWAQPPFPPCKPLLSGKQSCTEKQSCPVLKFWACLLCSITVSYLGSQVGYGSNRSLFLVSYAITKPCENILISFSLAMLNSLKQSQKSSLLK